MVNEFGSGVDAGKALKRNSRLCINPDESALELSVLNELWNDALKDNAESSSNPDGISADIPALKKKIKYCKNPLEKRCLEKQLNVDYKESRKRR